MKELVFLWHARTPHTSMDLLPSPSSASSSASLPAQPWAHCGAASRSWCGRAIRAWGTHVLSGCSLSSAPANAGTRCLPSNWGHGALCSPRGSSIALAGSGPSNGDMVSDHDLSKTNGASDCPITVSLVSSSRYLGLWHRVPLPAAA